MIEALRHHAARSALSIAVTSLALGRGARAQADGPVEGATTVPAESAAATADGLSNAAAGGASAEAPLATVDEGLRETFRLLDLPESWVIVLVLLPLLAIVSWIGYGRERLPNSMRWLLVSLRFVALAALLLVLFRPVLVQKREEVREAEVLVLLDDSASMRRRDAYGGDAELRQRVRRLASSLGGGVTGDGTDSEDPMRIELARAALEKELLPHLEEKGYGVRLFSFDEGLAPLTDPDALLGRGRATHVGDALNQVLASHRGRHVTDVLVITDGRSNGGNPPVDSGRNAGLAGIPVHTLVVGDTRPERNALVQLVEAPSGALAGDQIAATVRVSGRGIQGRSVTQVVLEELPQEGRFGSPRVVAEEDVALTEAGERVLLVAPPPMQRESRPVQRRFRVRLAPIEDETLLDDNQLDFSVHVTPEKIRVLYVDGYPRWEYRYLKNLLLRADENLQVQCYLLSATSDFIQESSPGLPALDAVPTHRKELLDNYDVVIVGDLHPDSERISPDPRKREEFQESLREFVERGGGVFFLAGRDNNPRSFVVSTQLQELLPVVVDTTGGLVFDGDTTEEVRPRLESPTAPHEVVRLIDDLELNRRLWEETEGLRGFYGYVPIPKAKPGAQVLLRHPNDMGSNGERRPLLIAGHYPAGRTMFLAIDSTWRWRYHFGDRHHERFWRNAIRWLSLGRLKSGDRRYRVETPRSTFSLGERATVEARILDEDYRPSEQSSQEVFWTDPDGKRGELDLSAAPARPGLFRGSFEPEKPGLYRVWIEVNGEPVSTAEFEVVLPSRENSDPSPDPDAMRELSLLSGGVSASLSTTATLLEQFPGDEERREPISSKLEDIWDHWGTLLFVLLVLSIEWILRKRMELV